MRKPPFSGNTESCLSANMSTAASTSKTDDNLLWVFQALIEAHPGKSYPSHGSAPLHFAGYFHSFHCFRPLWDAHHCCPRWSSCIHTGPLVPKHYWLLQSKAHQPWQGMESDFCKSREGSSHRLESSARQALTVGSRLSWARTSTAPFWLL